MTTKKGNIRLVTSQSEQFLSPSELSVETSILLEKIYNENAEKLIHWAYKELDNEEDAEDLCQEAMLKLYQAILKKQSQDEKIEDHTAYLWSIAFSIVHYHRKNSKNFKRMKFDLRGSNGVSPLNSNIDNDTVIPFHIQRRDAVATSSDTEKEKMMKIIKKTISKLRYSHRKIMYYHYIESYSIREIAIKFDMKEGYVKKILHEGRQMTKEMGKGMLDDMIKEYKPDLLNMMYSGEGVEIPDFLQIDYCLTRQNICLTCYEKPLNIDEIAGKLSLPKSYVEIYLKSLIQKDFINQKDDKYYTTFFIIDGNFRNTTINNFIKHKNVLELIIDKLKEKEKYIKDISFIGSEQPIERLLWFLVYNFIDLVSVPICFKENNYDYISMFRDDGGHYHPVGFTKKEAIIPLDPLFIEKYSALIDWKCSGTFIFEDGHNQISWFRLYNAIEYIEHKYSFKNMATDFQELLDVFWKAIKPDFDLESLNDTEKYLLVKLVQRRYLKIDRERRHLVCNIKFTSNVCILTTKQKNELDNIFFEILDEIRPELDKLQSSLKKDYTNLLPSHLHYLLEYTTYLGFIFSIKAIIGFAFYDNKIYKPIDEIETALLMSGIVTPDFHLENSNEFSLILRGVNYTFN